MFSYFHPYLRHSFVIGWHSEHSCKENQWALIKIDLLLQRKVLCFNKKKKKKDSEVESHTRLWSNTYHRPSTEKQVSGSDTEIKNTNQSCKSWDYSRRQLKRVQHDWQCCNCNASCGYFLNELSLLIKPLYAFLLDLGRSLGLPCMKPHPLPMKTTVLMTNLWLPLLKQRICKTRPS